MNLHSDYPFWMVKEGIINSFPSLRQPHQTEVLIIGGGITGALIAHRVAAAGLHVTVVEKRHIAYGSTAASTSMLQYEIDVPLFELSEKIGETHAARAFQLCSDAIDALEKMSARYPDAADFEKHPSLLYASFQKHVPDILEPEFTARLKHGFDVYWLDSMALEREFGFRAPAAILSRQGGQVNPYKLCHYLLSDLVKKGHHVYDLTEITQWKSDKKGVTIQTREGHEIQAKHLVLACGYETQRYLPKKVTDFNSSYAIVSKPLDINPLLPKNALIWETKTPYLYMRTTSDQRILVGGRDEVFSDAKKRDALIPKKRAQLEADFQKLFPEIPFQTDFAWAGTFAETKDGLPYIGPYDDPRIHFAMGYGGNGIVFSVVGAQIISDAIQGKKNPDAEIFRFDR